MENQHTPGPWYISKDAVPKGIVQVTVYAEDGERVATVFQSEANAQLCATAPDLLEIAQAILVRADADDQNSASDVFVLIDFQLRAAIDKATGQDS